MDKNKENLSLMKNFIDNIKEDNELLTIITNLINELNNLDPVWNDSINKILKLNITNTFKKKIKTFFKNISTKNYLLIFNVLLESYDVVEDLSQHIKEKAFYVILKELVYILNQQNITIQENYSKALKFLKKFRNTILT